MKKVVFAVIVIAIFIVISIFVQNKFIETANNILDDIEVVTKNIEDEKWNEVDTQLEDLVKKWEEINSIWALMIEHDEIDNLTISLSKSKTYANFREKEEALAEMKQFEFMVDHIPKIQKIQIKNIL